MVGYAEKLGKEWQGERNSVGVEALKLNAVMLI